MVYCLVEIFLGSYLGYDGKTSVKVPISCGNGNLCEIPQILTFLWYRYGTLKTTCLMQILPTAGRGCGAGAGAVAKALFGQVEARAVGLAPAPT